MDVMASREDYERYLFFESQREQAAKDHEKNRDDPQALLRWGGALLELAHFRQGAESLKSLDEAVDKFNKALKVDDKMHEAMWCLGNALTSQGLLQPSEGKATELFAQASVHFKKAVEHQPANPSYQRAVEMISKAPEIYAEVQKEVKKQEEQVVMTRGGAGASGVQTKEGASDFWYDLGGWVVLASIVTGVILMSSRGASSTATPSG